VDSAAELHEGTVRSIFKIGTLMSSKMVTDATLIRIRTIVATIFVSIVNMIDAEKSAGVICTSLCEDLLTNSDNDAAEASDENAEQLEQDPSTASRKSSTRLSIANVTPVSVSGKEGIIELADKFHRLRAVLEDVCRGHMKQDTFSRLSQTLQFYSNPAILESFLLNAEYAIE